MVRDDYRCARRMRASSNRQVRRFPIRFRLAPTPLGRFESVYGQASKTESIRVRVGVRVRVILIVVFCKGQ